MNSNFSVVLVSWIDLNTLFMAIKIQQKLFKINYFKENKKNFGSYEIKQTLPSSQTRILLRSSEILLASDRKLSLAQSIDLFFRNKSKYVKSCVPHKIHFLIWPAHSNLIWNSLLLFYTERWFLNSKGVLPWVTAGSNWKSVLTSIGACTQISVADEEAP